MGKNDCVSCDYRADGASCSRCEAPRLAVSLQMLLRIYLSTLCVLPRVCAGVRRGSLNPNRSIGLKVLRCVIPFTTVNVNSLPFPFTTVLHCGSSLHCCTSHPIAGTNSKYLHLGACVDACPQTQQEIGTGVDGREC